MTPLLLRAGLRHQTRHPWQLFLGLIGIAMGVAVVLAVDLANDAAKASFALSAQQVNGEATHRITATNGRLGDETFRNLFLQPDAPTMAPVIDAKIRSVANDEPLRLLGLDAFSEGGFRRQLTGISEDGASLGDWLADPQAATLSRAAADRLRVDVGEAFEITFEGRPYTLRASLVTDDTSLATRNLIVVDIATAQAVTGWIGELSHIDLRLTEDAAYAVHAKLGPAEQLVSVEDQLASTAGLSSAFELNLTAMSLLALLVGVFLIFNAISFSIVQRRRLLGRLRAIGVTRREIRQLVMREALVIAIIGSILGTLLGVWLGQGLTRIVAGTISALYYDVAAGALTWQSTTLLKAWLLGIGGTLFAAWLPARQAAQTPPLTTLSRAALETSVRRALPRVGAIGLLLIGAGLVIAIYLPGGVFIGFIGLFVLLIGAAMLTPLALSLIHRLLRTIPFRGIVRMAVRDIDRHLSRLGTAGAALMVAIAASVGVAVMVESMRGAVSDWLDALLTADIYVAAEAFQENAPLPSDVVAQLPKIDGVIAYSSYRDHNVDVAGRRTMLVAAELAPASRSGFEFLSGSSSEAWQAFNSGGVIISEPLSYRLGLQAGDRIDLATPDGMQAFDIGGVFRDFASEHGRAFIDADTYRTVWRDNKIDTVALFSQNSDAEVLLDRVTAYFKDRDDLTYTAAKEIHAESMRIFDRTFRITDVLRWLSLIIAFIGVLSALMALQLERRKEYAVLRALGLTRMQVSLLIVMESLILGLVASLLAIPVGLAMAWILTAAIQLRAFGWSMPLSLVSEPYLLALATGVGAALLASILPAQRASRENPAPQLRED